MGHRIPMAAAQTLRRKFFFKRSSRTVSPPTPVFVSTSLSPRSQELQHIPRGGGGSTFEYDEDQAHVAEIYEGLLPVQRQDVRDGHAVDEADDDLADEAGLDDLGSSPLGDTEDEEEGYDDQDGDDFRGVSKRWPCTVLHHRGLRVR